MRLPVHLCLRPLNVVFVRLRALELNHPFLVAVGRGSFNATDSARVGLTQALPASLHLVTHQLLRPNTLLVRIRNIFALSEAGAPVLIDLRDYFGSLESVSEMNLSGVQSVSFVDSRLQWNGGADSPRKPLNSTRVWFAPMETRTLILVPSRPA